MKKAVIIISLLCLLSSVSKANEPDAAALTFARKILEFVEMSDRRPELAAALKRLENKAAIRTGVLACNLL